MWESNGFDHLATRVLHYGTNSCQQLQLPVPAEADRARLTGKMGARNIHPQQESSSEPRNILQGKCRGVSPCRNLLKYVHSLRNYPIFNFIFLCLCPLDSQRGEVHPRLACPRDSGTPLPLASTGVNVRMNLHIKTWFVERVCPGISSCRQRDEASYAGIGGGTGKGGGRQAGKAGKS